MGGGDDPRESKTTLPGNRESFPNEGIPKMRDNDNTSTGHEHPDVHTNTRVN